MIKLSASEATASFGKLLDLVQSEPVMVMRRNRPVGFVVSGRDYEDMRAFYASRLQRSLDDTAQAADLTAKEVDRLLRNES